MVQDFSGLGMTVTTPLSPLSWATLGQSAVPIASLSGLRHYTIAALQSTRSGKARGVNPNRKSVAGVPKAVGQVNATPATPTTLLVPKQYRHSSFPWIRQPHGEGGLATRTTARLPYTLPRLRSSTGEDTPALLHRLMQTEGCRRHYHCQYFSINLFYS